MTMKGYIEIKVYMHNEESAQFEEMGIPTDFATLDTATAVFFNIDSIQQCEGFTLVNSGSHGYMTKEPFERLFGRIKEAFGL